MVHEVTGTSVTIGILPSIDVSPHHALRSMPTDGTTVAPAIPYGFLIRRPSHPGTSMDQNVAIGHTHTGVFPCESLIQMIHPFAILGKPLKLAPLSNQLPLLHMLRFRFYFDVHSCLNLVEVPRAKVVAIHSDVHRQGDRVVWQIAVRMPIELPRPARMAGPYLHRIIAQNNPLLADKNL